MKKTFILILASLLAIKCIQAQSNLPDNFVKIPNSTLSGKGRAVEIVGFNLRNDISTMLIMTRLHFYNLDYSKPDSIGTEIFSPELANTEHNMIAANDESHKCNPNNGYTVSRVQINDSTWVYKDIKGNVVQNPVGLFDFFKPLLYQPVPLMTLLRNNVIIEAIVYKTWEPK